jgi:hypothetical protein
LSRCCHARGFGSRRSGVSRRVLSSNLPQPGAAGLQRIGYGVWGVGFVWVRFLGENRVFDSASAENWVRFAYFFPVLRDWAARRSGRRLPAPMGSGCVLGGSSSSGHCASSSSRHSPPRGRGARGSTIRTSLVIGAGRGGRRLETRGWRPEAVIAMGRGGCPGDSWGRTSSRKQRLRRGSSATRWAVLPGACAQSAPRQRVARNDTDVMNNAG